MLVLTDSSIQSAYHPLNSWALDVEGAYRHVTTGQTVRKLPKSAHLVQDQELASSASATMSRSQRDVGADFRRCEVTFGQKKKTGQNVIGIKKTDGSNIWTAESDWRRVGSRFVNGNLKLFFELSDDEQKESESEEQEEEAQKILDAEDEGGRSGKGKGKMLP